MRALTWLLDLIGLKASAELGAWLGRAAYTFSAGERKKALASLAQAFPELTEEARARLAQDAFAHLGRAGGELVCYRELKDTLAQKAVFTPESLAVLRAAHAKGKGVVFVTGHIGSWEALGYALASQFPLWVIAKETTDPRLTRLVERFRAHGGVQTIWRGRPSAARLMLKALKAGDMLGILVDQDTDVQSVWVPFFGKLAKTPRAAGDLGLRTGAAIVFGTCQRQPDGTYRILIEDVPVPTQGDDDAKSVALAATFNALTEVAIRRAPEQWVWMHRRWKSPAP